MVETLCFLGVVQITMDRKSVEVEEKICRKTIRKVFLSLCSRFDRFDHFRGKERGRET